MKMILMMMMMTMAVIGEVVGEGTPTRVVLMSFDGFRYDYLDRPEASLPNMRALAENGVRSEIVPVFPAKRFPNEYTLVTGLYAEAHGIVSDSFYDEEHNDTFDMSRTESFWWEQGEPIWVTAERQNVTSAAYFWPGSEVRFGSRNRRFTQLMECQTLHIMHRTTPMQSAFKRDTPLLRRVTIGIA